MTGSNNDLIFQTAKLIKIFFFVKTSVHTEVGTTSALAGDILSEQLTAVLFFCAHRLYP